MVEVTDERSSATRQWSARCLDPCLFIVNQRQLFLQRADAIVIFGPKIQSLTALYIDEYKNDLVNHLLIPHKKGTTNNHFR